MHPGFHHWWKRAQQAAAEHGAWAGCGSGPWSSRERSHGERYETAADDLGPSFGVRRPLRFMAYKLDLNDDQVRLLAGILNDLKTERAQAAVDNQRTLSGIAESLAGDAFDSGKAGEALKLRVLAAERLRDAVLKALERTHALLDPEQRQKLAYLLRSGVLTI
jgi:Spy/CpxP family protein refolding chaperone